MLQKLRPAQVYAWHATLLKAGGKNGRALSARTVGHAHRILHRAFERALQLEMVARNPAHVVRPPKQNAPEVEILSPTQMADVMTTRSILSSSLRSGGYAERIVGAGVGRSRSRCGRCARRAQHGGNCSRASLQAA